MLPGGVAHSPPAGGTAHRPLCCAAAGPGCLDLHPIWAAASPPPASSLPVSSASTSPRKMQSDGSAAHSPLRPSPRETCSGGSAPPPAPPTPALVVDRRLCHTLACQLLPASSSSKPPRPVGTGPPWSSSLSSPAARVPGPFCSPPPKRQHQHPVCSSALPLVLAAQPTYQLPCQTCSLPLVSGSWSGKAPCFSRACPYPLTVPLEPGSSPVGLPRADSLQASWALAGAPICPVPAWAGPCPGLGGPLSPGHWLFSRKQARLGQITNDKQTGRSQTQDPKCSQLLGSPFREIGT